VGGERAKLLARLGIFTVEDLLLHKPRRYEDRRKFLSIRELKLGEPATVRGKIIAAGIKRFKKGTRAMFECVFDDGTARLHCRWWQAQPWMEDWFTVGREFLVFGKPDSLKRATLTIRKRNWSSRARMNLSTSTASSGASADGRADGARDADARLARAGEICSRAS